MRRFLKCMRVAPCTMVLVQATPQARVIASGACCGVPPTARLAGTMRFAITPFTPLPKPYCLQPAAWHFFNLVAIHVASYCIQMNSICITSWLLRFPPTGTIQMPHSGILHVSCTIAGLSVTRNNIPIYANGHLSILNRFGCLHGCPILFIIITVGNVSSASTSAF